MTGKTHMICGTITMAAITAVAFSGFQLGSEYVYYPAIGLLTVAAGSYMPDIDIERSKMGAKHPFISKMLTHRGITHTLLFPALLIVAMLFIAQQGIMVLPELIMGFTVGWVVHIIADLCNKKGVPLFWPIIQEKVHIAKFKTGTWHESVFIVLWLGVNAFCAYLQLK